MISIRVAEQADLPALLQIYNEEVLHGTATFDLHPKTLAERQVWFEQHNRDNHPLLTAELDGTIAGYASLWPSHATARSDSRRKSAGRVLSLCPSASHIR